ncbi:MAG: PorT family protein [Cyclobacteriaceae bacterium]
MRKIQLILLFSLVTLFNAGAQSKLGLKFSPMVASNRVSLVDSVYDVEPIGSAFKFSLGLIYDHELTETYFLSTGLIFVPKYFGVEVSAEPGEGGTPPAEPKQEYRLNYLQIPLSLKLFTNEIQPDTRVFFQVGLAPEIQIFNEPVEEDYDLIENFKGFDTTILFGGGVEYRAGINTTLFASVTYQRGLSNVIKTEIQGFEEELFVRNTVVSFDIGIKF